MSKFPSGYTELEYIQSSNGTYILTGIYPTNETRIVADMQLPTAPSSHIGFFGSRTAYNSSDQYVLGVTGAKVFRTDFASNQATFASSVVCTARSSIDKNGPACTINGTTVNNTSNTFTGKYELILFGINTAGTVGNHGVMTLWSFKIYESETLIRDFVPCKNASGVIGLYDTVGRQFYDNAGTGTFTAGPEVVYEPDAPTNFAASVSGQTVALSWAASANAAGYRLKRDGVQIADQTGTTYTDTVPDGTTLCTYALTAYNDAGESAAAALTVILRLDFITDRTRADVENQTDKGFYNASDLNRVGAAAEYIAGRFTALGYDCPVTVKKDWLTSDAPTASQLETYRRNIVTLRSRIAVMQSTPEAPASMAGLNYVKANNIEQILLDLDALITNITKSWYFSGEVYAGEV